MNDLHTMTVAELRDSIRAGQLGVREAAQAFLRRAEEIEPRVKAFLHLDEAEVLKQADRLQNELKKGALKDALLPGVPIAVKDVIVTRDVKTTCGSRILETYHPPYDATVVARLKENGAVVLGKTNCDEFAMGSSTENSAYFQTRNPWDPQRVPGGSSGGSAACVAAREAPASLGTDTGGSIRQPAAFCGVVGLKPTYGRVSRYGLVAFASSLDQIGPFAGNVRDVAIVLRAVGGWDACDSTSSRRPVGDPEGEIGRDVKGLRIGVVSEWFGEGLDPQVNEAVRAAIGRMENLGCRVEEVSLPHSEYAIATYYIVATAEASSNLARYDGVRYGYRAARRGDLGTMYRLTRSEGFGEEVKRRIMLGTYVLSAGYYDAYYLKAGKVRTLIRRDYEKAFEKVDVLMGPTTPTPPFKLGEKTADPLKMYLSDIYTVTANLAGIPGLSLPCAFTETGLPIGVQLLGPHFQEGLLLRAGHALESDLDLSFAAP